MRAKRLLYRVISFDLLAISATVAVASHFQQLQHQFGDRGFITFFSVAQLLVISFLAYKIFRKRLQQIVVPPWKSSIVIWLVVSAGFLFLALDDLLMVHELIDKSIHGLLRIQETALSDRIDDVIIGLYGLLALGVFAVYRRELKKYFAAAPLAVTAFVLLFLMVGVDIVTNRDDILLMLFSPDRVIYMNSWLFVLEESLKLLSEGFFIVSAYSCLQIAQRSVINPRPSHITVPAKVQNRTSRYE